MFKAARFTEGEILRDPGSKKNILINKIFRFFKEE
jgi:hypothetical protein